MRRIVIVGFPDVQTLDVVGPAEVFSMGDRLANGGEYDIEVVASSADAITTGSGLKLLPHRSLAGVRGPIDTLIVAGGTGVVAAQSDEKLVRWIRSAASRARRVASVCNGAFLLAEAGLLDGRRATTHWAACDLLRRRYPDVEVDEGPIFVRDGDIYTSAGVTAGIDLALALVEDDLGAAIARDAARWLVLFLRRPGSQAQFSDGPSWQPGRAASAARPAVLDRRQPDGRPVGGRARSARVHEPAQLRARVPARGRHDSRRVCRVGPARASPGGARGGRRVGRRRRRDVRFRNRRDDAARVPAPLRDQPRGLSQPLSHTRRLT